MNTNLLIAFCIAASCTITDAAPRISASYSISAEAADSGGRRATSTNYSNEGSAGLISGISTVTSPAQTAKHGYMAQLFEVTGLVVTAAASQVNESATLQIAASQTLDDSTLLVVPATSVVWSVVSGPIANINAAGLATASTVAENTAAAVQGVLGAFTGSLNLAVIDSIADNFSTYSGDGIGDDWQVQHFGQPPNPLAGPLFDPDGDGQNNAFEFIAGLTPTSASSIFRLRIEEVPGQPGQKKLIFSPRFANRTYIIKAKPDLATGIFSPLTSPSAPTENGDERTITDRSAAGPTKFYRVEITKP